MSGDDLAFASMTEQAAAMQRGELSALDLTKLYLERIDRLNDRLCAYITVDADGARQAAAKADEERAAGHVRSKLHGIPVAVKDQMLIDGVRVTGGSRLLEHHVPTRDATVIRRLKEAGAVLLGTLNTHEFHSGPTSVFPYGTPRNPWNTERITGGSSSGSASAVAAGLCSGSLGGDTGGSIRAPAGYCGVVGVKPTWSRVSRDGVYPLAWSLDCVGPLARTVEDAAAILEVVAGADAADPTASSLPVPAFSDELEGGLQGLRIGVVKEMMDAPLTGPEARAAVTDAIELLRAQGAAIEEVSLPLMAETRFLTPALIMPEAASYHRKTLLHDYEALDFNTRVSYLVGALLPAGLNSLAQRVRVRMAEEMLAIFERVDLLLGATTPHGAPPVTEAVPLKSKQDALERLYGVGLAAGQHTRVFSNAGVPAISVPCGFDQDGLPLGLHLAAAPFRESTMFQAAHAYQGLTDWHQRRPALA